MGLFGGTAVCAEMVRGLCSVCQVELGVECMEGALPTPHALRLLPRRPPTHRARRYNGTLMAYGQTGAGKTYSLSSIAADAIGMIPRAAAEVFAHIEGDPGHQYSVVMSYVQLYMELIQVCVGG